MGTNRQMHTGNGVWLTLEEAIAKIVELEAELAVLRGCVLDKELEKIKAQAIRNMLTHFRKELDCVECAGTMLLIEPKIVEYADKLEQE